MASLTPYSTLWSTPPNGESRWKLDDIGAQGMHPGYVSSHQYRIKQ